MELKEIKSAIMDLEAGILMDEGYTKIRNEIAWFLKQLAQAFLNAKCPEEKEFIFPRNNKNNDRNCEIKGYNQALSDFRLWQMKCLAKIKKILKQGLQEIYYDYSIEDEDIEELAQAIKELFEKGEKDNNPRRMP